MSAGEVEPGWRQCMCGLCEANLTREHLAPLTNPCPVCGRFEWNPEESDRCYHCAFGDADCVYCQSSADAHAFACSKCGREFLSRSLDSGDPDWLCGLCLFPYPKMRQANFRPFSVQRELVSN